MAVRNDLSVASTVRDLVMSAFGSGPTRRIRLGVGVPPGDPSTVRDHVSDAGDSGRAGPADIKEIAALLVKGIAGAALVTIPARHMANLDARDAFNRAVGAFVVSHDQVRVASSARRHPRSLAALLSAWCSAPSRSLQPSHRGLPAGGRQACRPADVYGPLMVSSGRRRRRARLRRARVWCFHWIVHPFCDVQLVLRILSCSGSTCLATG